MSRNAQVSRVIRMLHLLELNPQGLRARELHSRLNDLAHTCSRETVYRDLGLLQKSGMPVSNEGTGDEAVWKIVSLVTLSKNVHFTYNELMALFIARETLKTFQPSPIHDIIDSFFMKLEKLFGVKAHQGLSELGKSMAVRPTAAWSSSVPPEVIAVIHSAASEGHVLEIDYRSVSGENAGVTIRRRVGPASLLFASAGAYLVAWDFKDKIFKHYALARIEKAEMTDEAYDSHGFDASELYKHDFGVLNQGTPEEVEIVVEEPIASFVAERFLHPSQKVTRNGRTVTLEMNVKINDEFARWVLSLGPQAQVVKPESLITAVYELSVAIASKHAPKKSA